LADGHPDLTGHWLPNSAGQGVSGRYGVDPAATRQFDPKVTPEERPSFQPWALEKIKSMTPTELELSKSSVNCMPRGVPAIWLQNPYSTMMVHKPDVLVQLYEVLNNFRVIHLDGRPLPKYPEPLFHGNSSARWEGDTLVVESNNFRGVQPENYHGVEPDSFHGVGWLDHRGSPYTEAMKVTERFRRVNYGQLDIEFTVDDPKAYTKPFTVRVEQRIVPDGSELIEFICHENQTFLKLTGRAPK
jgi:hypothetical protein